MVTLQEAVQNRRIQCRTENKNVIIERKVKVCLIELEKNRREVVMTKGKRKLENEDTMPDGQGTAVVLVPAQVARVVAAVQGAQAQNIEQTWPSTKVNVCPKFYCVVNKNENLLIV